MKAANLIAGLLGFGLSVSAYGQACKQAVITGEAKSGESYSRAIGVSSKLRLLPLIRDWGWTISVSPNDSDEDWTFPVTFPLRTGEAQLFGTGYGTTARERLKYPATVHFVLNERDYQRYAQRAYETLESTKAEAAGEYIAQVKHVVVGLVAVEAVDYDRSEAPEVVKWMKFKVTIVVPKSFGGAAELSWSAVECPSRQ
jgi:hypothetical protein